MITKIGNNFLLMFIFTMNRARMIGLLGQKAITHMSNECAIFQRLGSKSRTIRNRRSETGNPFPCHYADPVDQLRHRQYNKECDALFSLLIICVISIIPLPLFAIQNNTNVLQSRVDHLISQTRIVLGLLLIRCSNLKAS